MDWPAAVRSSGPVHFKKTEQGACMGFAPNCFSPSGRCYPAPRMTMPITAMKIAAYCFTVSFSFKISLAHRTEKIQ